MTFHTLRKAARRPSAARARRSLSRTDGHAGKRRRSQGSAGQDAPPPGQIGDDLKAGHAVGHADLHSPHESADDSNGCRPCAGDIQGRAARFTTTVRRPAGGFDLGAQPWNAIGMPPADWPDRRPSDWRPESRRGSLPCRGNGVEPWAGIFSDRPASRHRRNRNTTCSSVRPTSIPTLSQSSRRWPPGPSGFHKPEPLRGGEARILPECFVSGRDSDDRIVTVEPIGPVG